jgi:hypothetical protein
MTIKPWVRLPSAWIHGSGLANMKWKSGGEGSDNIAALMALTAIAHAADEETGGARATYDQLCALTGLSRAKLSNGLQVLDRLEILKPGPEGFRSTYRLVDYDPQRGWAKFPAKSMYSSSRIAAFGDFRLRRVAELDALKLFFLFVAHRDRNTNFANIGYDKIEEYTEVKRARIKTAISFLASLSLIYVEHVPSKTNPQGISNAYRIVGVEPYKHMGTRGRAMDEFDSISLG